MKHYKWEGTKLTYAVPGAGEASVDVAALPEAVKLAALQFGVQTAARNATAGFFEDEPETAFKRMAARFKNWMDGAWKAASAGGEGERKTSLLSQAVAEAGGITPEAAAEHITAMIEAKVAEANLSPDEDADKPAIRKIGAAVRGAIGELPEVAAIYARLRRENAEKVEKAKADAAAKAKAEGKVGGLADLLKK